ncbi:MAG TPA: cytidylate kinase-like family protein [Dehalococcoidia bacterium]
MSTSVVCVSRTLAAGGEELGRAVAEQLGFRYADDEILDRAAEKAGVSRDAVAGAERPPGLLMRILESMATAQVAEAGAWTTMPSLSSSAGDPSSSYEELIQDVIREFATQGKVVIVAHGGSACLRGVPSVLRVLVTAPVEVRIDRLSKAAEIDAGRAKKAVTESDKRRQEYFQRFYHAREDPTDYDLVVNTDVLGVQGAAKLVAQAADHG